MEPIALPAPQSSTWLLIISDLPLVSWGVQASLVGLPDIVVTRSPWQEQPLASPAGGELPTVIVATPPRPHAPACERLAAWRRRQPAPTVVCLAPSRCPRCCRQADFTIPLAYADPLALRGLLRRALDQVRARTPVGERRPPHDPHPGRDALYFPAPIRISAREREIGLLVAEGFSSAQIAQRLFISPRTVEKHRANLMAKLAVSNAAALTRELLYLCWTEAAAPPAPPPNPA